MFKKHIFTIVVFLLFFFLWGCTPHENVDDFSPQYLVEELVVWDFTVGFAIESLPDVVAELNFDMPEGAIDGAKKLFKKDLNKEICGVALSYNTFDPFGDPVIATGAFFYPKDMKPRGIVEVPPIAQMNDNQAPSLYVERRKFALESLPSLLSYITINPDFVGVRYTEHWPRPYLLENNAGLVAYHFRKAVEEYLLIHENYRLGNKSTIMGYSLGGSTAMAMARHYTSHPTGINVDKVYSGGGVYDGLEAFRAYARKEKNDYQSIPMVIIGLNTFYNLNLDFTKLFVNGMENPVNSPDPEEGGDGYAWWFSGKRTLESIYKRWGSNLRDYMHPDFFVPELQGEFLKLKEPLEENSIVYSDWIPGPTTEIHLLHSAEDNLIPVECADLLYKEFKKRGCAITYTRTTGTHYDAGFHFVLTAALYLLAK